MEDGRYVPARPVHPLSGERRLRILASLVDAAHGDITSVRLCEVCRTVTGVTGAGIMLMSDDLPLGSACTTSDVSALIEELQFTLGEGPCVDAYHLGRPVIEADLARPSVPRWPAFTGPALAGGVRAVFGFPLVVGAVRLGALNLYRDRRGALTDDQHADALVMADVAAEALLVMQAGASLEGLTAALEAGSNLGYVVHQAAGMVSAQLDMSVAQALVRLRAHAFGNQRPIADVAGDVVARRLRFASES